MLQTCARHMGSRIVRPHGHLGVLAQEGFVETAVHRHDLASGFREAVGDEEEVGLRLVRWRDGRAGQGALGVELASFVLSDSWDSDSE